MWRHARFGMRRFSDGFSKRFAAADLERNLAQGMQLGL